MAKNVTVQQIGAQPKVLNDVSTVKEVMDKLGITNASAKINGEDASESEELSDYCFLSFGEKVKGGAV